MAVRMELSRILIQELDDMQVIELREVDGDRSFPIAIGLPEAMAIDRRLSGKPVPRPQTHDLLASVIKALGGELESILIRELSEHTFFANLYIRQGEELIDIDCRPSDAIALGIANDVPIYVNESVLEAAVL
ncbi:MAG TPA: bifunctional nuclease family protein [Phycisphaeraceae bacterium]|nr:bifunctional nuclease family protein [Phycisphaeraceae bacterium]